MAEQLTLGVNLTEGITFNNFVVGDNDLVIDQLRNAFKTAEDRFIYLYGAHGVGKTHLLHACCHEVISVGKSIVYLPLKKHIELSLAVFDGLEHLNYVCLDDVDAIVGNHEWEAALFHLYNRILDNKGSLIVTASASPRNIDIRLNDLKSRLAWGFGERVRELDDEQKILALQLRAEERGIRLPNDVGRYLLCHHARNLGSLMMMLDRLDQASLTAQRRLTIPFVRSLL